MTTYVISTGQFISNLSHADTATIEQKGRSLNIVDGGLEIVVAGGAALSTTVSSGQLTLSNGGSALGAILSAGGSETVSSGGETSSETIFNGGSSLVLAGGVASAIAIESGGVEQLSGGVAYSLDIAAGGLVSGTGVVSSAADYGTASGVTVGLSFDVFSGGAADGLTVSGLGAPGDYYHEGLFVSAGGFAYGTLVGSAGYLELDGAANAAGTVIGAGGVLAGNGGAELTQITSNAGVVSTVMINGQLIDEAGGYNSADTILASATVSVAAGGSTYADTLERSAMMSGAGVVFSLDDLGTVSGARIGSSLDVSSGGLAEGVIDSGLAAPGDYYHYGLFVSAGGAASGTIVGSAGYLELDGNGSAANTTVSAGGYLAANTASGVLKGVTSDAGLISGAIVSGTLVMLSGGSDRYDTLVAGSVEQLGAGASTFGDVLDHGAVLSGAGVVFSLTDLGTVSGVTIGSSLDVSSGGVAEGVIDSGLAAPGDYYHYGLFVSAGASATGTLVGAAGYLELDGNGSAFDTTIKAGGYLLANTLSGVLTGVTSDAGLVSNAIISGTLVVLAGGCDRSDTLVSGSIEQLAAGASTFYDVVDHGAVLSGGGVVSSLTDYGTVSGVIVGSSIDVEAGGVALGVRDSGLSAPGNYYHYGLFVSSGASATGTTVGLDGYLELDGTGSAAATTIGAGGVVDGVGGGYLTSATINAGLVENLTLAGSLADLAGASDLNDTLVSGASDAVETGASADNITVSAGARLYGGGVVSSGNIYGLVSNVTVGSSLDIQAGGVADAISISGLGAAGDYYHQGLFVHAGGQASGAVVGSAGYLELDGTGSAIATTVKFGGVLSGVGGGVVKGATANAGLVENLTVSGTLTDLAGAADDYDTIAAGGVDLVEAGAVASNVTIDLGGLLSGGGVVYSGDDFGTVSELSVGLRLDVSSGGVADDVTISGLGAAGNYYHEGLFISSGASATGTVIGSAGYLELDGNGSAAGTIVEVGGYLSANGGALVGVTSNLAVVSNVTVSGELIDYAGGNDQGDVIASGGLDDVKAGASTYRIDVASGGVVTGGGVVFSGDDYGLVEDVAIGSSLEVESGGVAEAVSVSGLAAPGSYYHYGLFVSAGGSALDPLVGASGYLENDGGVVAGAVISAGGVFDDGGLASGVVVLSGGLLSGTGSAAGLIVASSGATVDLAAIVSGGVDEYYQGASESLTVSSGGVLALAGQVLSAGETLQVGRVTATETVSGVTVLSGATVELAATLVETGETLDLTSGAVVSGIQVQSGATLAGPGLLEGQILASSGATLSGESLASGAQLSLSGGAVASNLTIARGAAVSGTGLLGGQTTDDGSVAGALVGGQFTIASGGQLSGATLVPGATVNVASGGKLEGVIRLAGPFTLEVQQGATISAESINEFYSSPPQSLTLAGGDTLELVSGVVGSGVTETAGKQVTSGIIDGVTLDPGATLALVQPIVNAGGTLDIRFGASVSGAQVSAGGAVVVSSGGALVAPTVNGSALFEAGASLLGALAGAGAVIEEGGSLALSSASTFGGQLVISAGQVELAAVHAAGSAAVDFAAGSAGSARLLVDAADTPAAGATFANALVNFSQDGDSVLLAGLADAGGSATAAVHGSTLVLTDGGKQYDFNLGGQIAPSFVVTSVGGGTLITADPPTTSAAHLLVQAMSTFGASNEAPGAATGSSQSSSPGVLIAAAHPTAAGSVLRRD